MNLRFGLAGGLLVLLGLAHTWLGETALLMRLFKRTDFPKIFGSEFYTRRILRFAWHLTTIVWLAVGALFLPLSASPADATAKLVAKVFAVVFLVSGLYSIWAVHARHFSSVVFLSVAVLPWMGSR